MKILSMPRIAPPAQTYTGSIPNTNAGGGTNTVSVGTTVGNTVTGTITLSANHYESSGVYLEIRANGVTIQSLKNNGSVTNGETVTVNASCNAGDTISIYVRNNSGIGGGLVFGGTYTITM